MCGIFGLIIKPESSFNSNSVAKILKEIALLSESRGKDSSGIAFRKNAAKTIDVVKGDIPIRELIDSSVVSKHLKEAIDAYKNKDGFSAFGHARLVTNGSQLQEVNNQPVLKDNTVLIHNGIIVNVDELWANYPTLSREFEIDTEIISALIKNDLKTSNHLITSINRSFKQLRGTFSIALMFNDLNQFVLATNNGSLYYISDNSHFIVFASEAYFLKQLIRKSYFRDISLETDIKQVLPNNGLIVNYNTLSVNEFSLNDFESEFGIEKANEDFHIQKHLIENAKSGKDAVIDPSLFINRGVENHLFNLLEYNIEAISKIKRCTKCLLPETFPFIEFDHEGVCNYCHNHKSSKASKTTDDLEKLVAPYRKGGNKPDCIVPFSGGRDSTYSLHLVKKELGLNPIAFTYDWGMVTDLARRNIARVCGKLGVENIIVSADIRWKRENIRKNIEAWLKHPALGMIPLFMAGDKFFFYYCNQVKKQTGIDLNIWGINDLENTNFKTGFGGMKPNFDKKTIYSLSLQNKLKLFAYVGQNLIKSPGYINASIFDSLGSFAARYISPKKDYYHLFDYYQWDENEVNNLVLNEYDWELAIDTSTTWRIGDGTASFYNYIYYTVAGFSENDTFRSNQIREGMLDRETALKLVHHENIPRYETMRWYLEIIQVDFEKAIKAINNIPKLYLK